MLGMLDGVIELLAVLMARRAQLQNICWSVALVSEACCAAGCRWSLSTPWSGASWHTELHLLRGNRISAMKSFTAAVLLSTFQGPSAPAAALHRDFYFKSIESPSGL